MATVVFLTENGKEAVRVEARTGDALVDLCDESSSPVPFSCRSASCGTCRIVVEAGADQLDEPRDEELDVLDAFGSKPPRMRLACQAKLGANANLIHVRPVRDNE
jgi:ferredoxin